MSQHSSTSSLKIPPFHLSAWEQHYRNALHPMHPVSYSRPQIIGFYDPTDEKEQRDEDLEVKAAEDSVKESHPKNSLPYPFKMPPKGTNLAEGFSNELHERKVLSHQPESLKREYEALLHHVVHQMKSGAIKESPHVLTFRNNLNKIMGTPYQGRNSWEFVCQKLGETLFLHMVIEEEENMREDHKRFVHYGYKFEMECLDIPEEEQGNLVLGEVGSNMVVGAMLNRNMRLLIGAEVDCMDSKGALIPLPQQGVDVNNLQQVQSCLVELKTNKTFQNDRDASSFARFKAMRIWIQSYLVGVEHIAVGFHSNGILDSVRHYPVQQLPALSRNWNSAHCLRFTHDLLSWIGKSLKEEDSYRVVYDTKTRSVNLTPEETPLLETEFVKEWREITRNLQHKSLKRDRSDHPSSIDQRDTKRRRHNGE